MRERQIRSLKFYGNEHQVLRPREYPYKSIIVKRPVTYIPIIYAAWGTPPMLLLLRRHFINETKSSSICFDTYLFGVHEQYQSVLKVGKDYHSIGCCGCFGIFSTRTISTLFPCRVTGNILKSSERTGSTLSTLLLRTTREWVL